MIDTSQNATAVTSDELSEMHDTYRRGGERLSVAPHVVYSDAGCPHSGCGARLQAIDFCLKKFGKSIHDPLVNSWWSDVGFAGRCPQCRGWIHFTIRGKRAITASEAAVLPSLPDDWHDAATVL